MEKKITKKEMFNEIVKVATEIGRTDIVEFANHEIELLEKKSASHTQTKTQVENEALKTAIVDCLKGLDKKVTITELQENCPEVAELSNQKVSALLKQLVDAKVINKEFDKKKAYFGV